MILFIAQPVAVAIIFIWIGLILGISFLEAWLKFRAPGVTASIGLSIGRLVFGALNKIEWLLAMVLMIGTIARQEPLLSAGNVVISAIWTILIVQTAWLLPVLNKRAQQVINHQPVKPSSRHVIFIAAELIKVGLLLTAGISLLNDL